ncbi:MAG: methyltransferase domain-containing protein [Candidatus Aenigmatarchaeota archaeon]
MKLNIGCGSNKINGYVNCDIDSRASPDKVIDITKKLPFKTNSVDEIVCFHTLEHIPQHTLVAVTLPEMWRVCKPGATLKIRVPYMDAQTALNHHTRFNEDTFKNWCRDCFEKDPRNSESFPFNFSFHVEKIELGKSKAWKWIYSLLPLKVWKGLWSHLVEEIRIELKAEK